MTHILQPRWVTGCLQKSNMTHITCQMMLFRKALMLLLLEAAILLIAFTSDAIDTDRIEVVLVIAGSVLVIFALANLFLWWKDTAEAKKLNQELAAYQALHT